MEVNYETTCSRGSAIGFRHGLGPGGRYLPKQSGRQGRPKAIDKNGKPLAGAAKTSFMKKCESEA
jgi:hypothetical protein